MKNIKIISLFPLIVFIIVFIGSGIYYNDFYKFPSPIAALIGVLVAFVLFKDSLNNKIETFIKGCGDSKIITMCIIYLLAGAFTTVTKAIGATDFMVALGIGNITPEFLIIGVFVISCVLSFSIGTSVGCIVALGPIVVGLAEYSPDSLPMMAGALLGGAMFGDNLSLISDTTIAATQVMDCQMKDKFIANFKLAFAAAFLTVIAIYFTQPQNSETVEMAYSCQYYLLIPYVTIIVLSILGLHVFLVLIISIILAITIGLFSTEILFIDYMKLVYDGFLSVNEIFLLSLITGGLAALIEKAGGIDYIINHIQKIIKGSRSANAAIALVVSLVNLAVANNTVAIIVSGPIAKKIATDYQIEKAKATSVLDIFSCIIQGIIPYGAQVLILLSLVDKKMGYFDLLSNSYYILFLFIITVISIVLNVKNRVKPNLSKA
ncbi:Na+/H+ antiporter NhaC family protein [Flavobacterium sp. I3-2]|uniref:Na+/H+ antiporter NhaC family protein n=1 Tax=Flavobacterium sp. I3-2 TaxID=2748319 RepID=UPI0015B113DA|nr:Na+/H+ antiporter NhaC family protein [Flavobacterium sp. I3-2]